MHGSTRLVCCTFDKSEESLIGKKVLKKAEGPSVDPNTVYNGWNKVIGETVIHPWFFKLHFPPDATKLDIPTLLHCLTSWLQQDKKMVEVASQKELTNAYFVQVDENEIIVEVIA